MAKKVTGKKPEGKRVSELTDKQKRFCEEYTIDFNGNQAAIRSGYSPKTAMEQASRLLTNVKVQEFIQKLQQKTSEKLNITKERVLNEYRKIAFSDVRNVLTDNGSLKSVSEIDDDTAGALAGIESFDEYSKDGTFLGTNRKIRLHNKLQALQDLGKHLGLFEKDNDQSKPVVNNIISLGEGVDPNAGTTP